MSTEILIIVLIVLVFIDIWLKHFVDYIKFKNKKPVPITLKGYLDTEQIAIDFSKFILDCEYVYHPKSKLFYNLGDMNDSKTYKELYEKFLGNYII